MSELRVKISVSIDEVEAFSTSIGPTNSWDALIVKVVRWILSAKVWTLGDAGGDT